MHLAGRILVSIAVFLIVAVVLYWVIGEVAVYYEMWATDTASRQELADDFGLGLIGLTIVVPASFLGALIAAVVAWRRLSTSNT